MPDTTFAQELAAASRAGAVLDAGARGMFCTLGDSLVNGGYSGSSFAVRAARQSRGRHWHGPDFAAGGKRTDQIIGEQLPAVLASGYRRAVFTGSTNDISQNGSAGELAARENFKTITAALVAAGIQPIAVGNFPNNVPAQASVLTRHDLWRQLYCAKNGIPFAMPHVRLANPDGSYKTGANLDNTHPNSVGADIAAAELLAVLDAPWRLQPFGALIDSNTTGDVWPNAVSFGGVGPALPAGYNSLGSGAAYSVEAPTDGSFGNWLVATYAGAAAAGTGLYGAQRSLTQLGWSAGDRVAIAMRLKTVANGPETLKPRIQMGGSLAGKITTTWPVLYDDHSGAAGGDFCVYYEATIGADALGSDTFRVQVSATAASGPQPQRLMIRRPIVYNLTKNGFA